MPEMRFLVRWPDGRRDNCYSPSLVVREFLNEGADYAIPEFVALSRQALTIASERVRAKYGHACSLALGQLAAIESAAAIFADQPHARVTCEAFLTED
jgi:uncharacterized repeat protein (TIGR04042 family)